MSDLQLGGADEMETRRRLMAALMGQPAENFSSATLTAPGVQGLIEQSSPQSTLDGDYSNVYGSLDAKVMPWLTAGANANQFLANDYEQQNVGGTLRADIPIGGLTLSPEARISATNVPGEWGTQGWQRDPAKVGGRLSAPLGDGYGSVSMLAGQGQKPSYSADMSVPLGAGFNLGGEARMTPADENQKRRMQMLFQLTKQF